MPVLQQIWNRLVGDLGWVDLSALTVVALFFLLGLCKGMVWQVGRVVALLGSYGAAAQFGPRLAAHVFAGAPHSHPHVYLAYAVTFLATFVLLSGAARLAQSMVRRAGLGLYDRLAGGLVGVGTGSAVVFGVFAVVLMFGSRFPVYAAVQESRTIAWSRRALAVLGTLVPDPVQAAFAPPPERIAAVEPRATPPQR